MATGPTVMAASADQTPGSRPAPRLLFIPVSGTHGMGEYARSLAIATAASRQRPHAAIHFILSREAPYAASVPFAATLLPSSPTFHSAAVIELIEKWRPDVVIFDNAGRTAQLRAAQRSGARVVYISARRRQRRKAFRWRWMRLIDEHWIAYPEFVAGGLGFFERLKRRLSGRPVVRYLDVILSRALPGRREALLRRAGCDAGSFVLVVPGGGTGHPGADDAVERFMSAGHVLAMSGVPTVYVGPVNAPGAVGAATERHPIADSIGAVAPNWHPLGPLPQADLAELMRSARLIIANGGSTLLQAIACGAACIAVPIAKDQAERTRRCVAAGVAVTAALDTAGMVQAANRLLQDEGQRSALARRAVKLGLADGIDVALRSLSRLIETAPHSVPD
jgi:glycosyltransferase involved in cell wall biosynthesis